MTGDSLIDLTRWLRHGVLIWLIGTVLALLWKFQLERVLDPFLPGIHAVESPAERWEFVVVCSVLIGLATMLPSLAARRLSQEMARLASRQEAARKAFYESPAPMFVANGERVFTVVNAGFCDLIGESCESLMAGRHINDFIVPSLDDLNYLSLELGMRETAEWSGPVSLVGRNGTIKGRLSLRTHRDELDNAEYFIGVVHV